VVSSISTFKLDNFEDEKHRDWDEGDGKSEDM
jgi:hypothetical protein